MQIFLFLFSLTLFLQPGYMRVCGGGHCSQKLFDHRYRAFGIRLFPGGGLRHLKMHNSFFFLAVHRSPRILRLYQNTHGVRLQKGEEQLKLEIQEEEGQKRR